MKKTRLLALLLALVMVIALFAACGNTEPEETTDTSADTTAESTTAEDTTAEDTTAEDTTAEDTTAEDTTAAGINLDGYKFVMGHNGLMGLTTGDNASTAEGVELQEAIAAIEDKLNCTITFTDNGSSDDMEKVSQLAASGDYGADLFQARQSCWIPATIANYIVAFDELADQYGLDIYNEDVCNQTYLKMSELNGHYMALDFTGKYTNCSLGHFYAFNSALVDEAGTSAEDLYQAIRDFEWDYEMFLDIGSKITKDTDGDGQYDIWAVALDCDGNEAWTNGTGPIVLDESGKWVANLTDSQLTPSLQFMYDLSGNNYTTPVYGDTVGRGDRREMFYGGTCGFAGLYGNNIAPDGTGSCSTFDVGVAPIPHGPDAETYMMNVVDCDWMIMMNGHPNKEAASAVINELGAVLCDWDAYVDTLLVNLNYSEECMEVINDYLIPNGKMNIAKCSDNMYEIVRKQFYADIYKLEKTPAQAAEAYQSVVQAELDAVFGY